MEKVEAEKKQPIASQAAGSGNWTSTQAYILAVFVLVLGHAGLSVSWLGFASRGDCHCFNCPAIAVRLKVRQLSSHLNSRRQ